MVDLLYSLNPAAKESGLQSDAVADGEVWLLNCHISPYEHGSYDNHEALRKRKLLLRAEEMRKLKA